MRLLSLRLLTASSLVLLLALPARAQGNCEPGEATARLDATNVSAPLRNDGSLFWDASGGGVGTYEVPKGGGVAAIFWGHLWVSGRVDDELRVAATVWNGQQEFWPGPLSTAGAPPADCAPFDRIYVVAQADIDAYDATGVATADLAEWPAALGAPVVDGDGIDGNYDLAAGDRPDLGDAAQTAWWVMNDAGNVHESTDTSPIGLEARVQAFVYAAGGDVPDYAEQATFFEVTLVYRGSGSFEQAYASLQLDGDLGNYLDDYVGSAPELGMAFLYNADDEDENLTSTLPGYGTDPPALGVVGLEGSQSALAEVVYARSFFGPEAGPVGGPSPLSSVADPELVVSMGSPARFDWRVHRVQRTRNPETDQRLQYGFDGAPTGFLFPDTPPGFWSEFDASVEPGAQPLSAGDRRQLVTFGPFDLEAGDAAQIRFGVLWARAPGGGALGSLAALRADALDFIGGETRLPEAVSAGSLEATGVDVRQGETAQIPVPYDAHGGSPLEITLEPGPEPIAQTILRPLTATIQPGTFGEILVTVEPGDLAPGEYEMTMIKRTSDRNEPVGVVPVIVSVQPPLAGEDGPDDALVLLPPAPNPARGVVSVRYRTRRPGAVRLSLTDALGREVLTLARDAASGEHTALIDTRGLSAGVYALLLESAADRVLRRLTVVR